MNDLNIDEQDALTHMWGNNFDNINIRYKLMNKSYNMGLSNIKNNLNEATLPIKVAHFHPHKKRHLDLYAKLLPVKLLAIFNSYGIKSDEIRVEETILDTEDYAVSSSGSETNSDRRGGGNAWVFRKKWH
jgi:hypothetical protein